MTPLALTEELILPDDGFAGGLAGRVWRADVEGPSVVSVRPDGVFDVSAEFPTMRDLCEQPSPAEALRRARGPRLGPISEILAQTPRERRAGGRPYLLAPIDLQAIKAAGVTFARSLLERVIEERAHGDPERAQTTREAIAAALGARTPWFQAGIAGRDAAEGGADRGWRLVAIPRSRHRPGRRSLHQGPADVRGRLRRRRRFSQRLALEQPGAGSCACRRIERAHCRRDPRQRRQPARFRRAFGAPSGQGERPECELRDRSLSALFRRDLRPRRHPDGDNLVESRRRGRVSPRRPLVDGRDKPRPRRSRRRRRSGRATPIPTGSSSCSARCSLPSQTAGNPEWASRIRQTISSPSKRKSSVGSSIG